MTLLAENQSLVFLLFGMIATGVVGGFLAGLLGVGGGIVIVPVLVVVLEFLEVDPAVRMHVAVATSLGTIIPTSISSARSHNKKAAVRWDLIRRWAVAIVLGAAGGVFVATFLRSAELSLIFGGVALAVALFMLIVKEGKALFSGLPKGPTGQLAPMGIGGFSTLMGIGGGTLGVPALSACGMPVRNAVATASVFGLLISVPSVTGYILTGWENPLLPGFCVGYVNLLGVIIIAPVTYVVAPFGARLAHAIPSTLLRRCFAVFLLLTSAKMIYTALG